jgi:hypothetical protein
MRFYIVLYMASELYYDTYRVASARLRGYDYEQNEAYFITICTQHRTHYFDDIVVLRNLTYFPPSSATTSAFSNGRWRTTILHTISSDTVS